MIMKPCPRCKRMMVYGPAYCTACAPLAAQELEAIRQRNAEQKQKRYNQRRDPKYLTFYRSKAWRTTSQAKLQSVGYKCEARLSTECQGMAVEVHHINPIQPAEGWDERLTWENLEAVCTVCHNLRHPEKLRKPSDPGVIDLKTVR